MCANSFSPLFAFVLRFPIHFRLLLHVTRCRAIRVIEFAMLSACMGRARQTPIKKIYIYALEN